MGGGGDGQVKTVRLPVLQNFGLKLTLYLIKWKIKNCNIRKDIWKVSFTKRKKICFSVLGLVLNGCCPKALLGGSSKDDDSNERNNLARAQRFFRTFLCCHCTTTFVELPHFTLYVGREQKTLFVFL